MKRRCTGGMLAVCVFALAGCSSGGAADVISAERYVQTIHNMLEEADSFAAHFQASVQMKGSGSTKTEGAVTMVKEPLFMNVDTALTFDTLTQEYDMYLEQTEDAVNQYVGYDGEWTEMTLDEDAALVGTQIYNTLYNMEAILSAAENWTAERADGDIVLTGNIPEAKFYDVEEYTRWFQLAGMSGLSETYYADVGDVPVEVFLDSKTGSPKGYAVELAHALETVTNNVLKELGGGTLEEPVEVEAYTIVSEFTQLGEVEAWDIPMEAKNTAINYEKEISLLEGEK